MTSSSIASHDILALNNMLFAGPYVRERRLDSIVGLGERLTLETEMRIDEFLSLDSRLEPCLEDSLRTALVRLSRKRAVVLRLDTLPPSIDGVELLGLGMSLSFTRSK
jgi:hypothetical protein